MRAAVASRRAAVIVAAPAAGKTTRVPPALADAGRVVVLQPRRVAARAVARRIAEDQGWTLGREVGWHVRFDRRFTADTRVLIVTEGMLTHYLDEDPLLSDVSTVVLDEFHERSLHTDIGLALVSPSLARTRRPAHRRHVRYDGPSARSAPISTTVRSSKSPAVTYPLTITYRQVNAIAAAVARPWPSTEGDLLCFLPGAGDIERAMQDAEPFRARHGVDLLPLHGSLDAEAQDRAIRPGPRRRVVLATNLAETSLTVPGVSVVIDSGWQKVARYDAERAIDTLALERVTDDSAAQRAGRAARLGPGLARRLWDVPDRLRTTREPEIHRVDLAGILLALMAAGVLLGWLPVVRGAGPGAGGMRARPAATSRRH